MKKSDLKNGGVILTLKAIKIETLSQPKMHNKKWYSVGDKIEKVVAYESRECSTTYDWGNFNTEFRQKLDKDQVSYDYIVCDDDYELFNELVDKRND